MTGSGTMVQSNTVVKLNKQEEEELIRELENQAMENDTLKELDEALMDRTTAQKTLRNKSQFMTQHTKINSSNFQKSSQEPAQAIKKLKQMSQQTSLPAAAGPRNKTASGATQKSASVTDQLAIGAQMSEEDVSKGQFTGVTSVNKLMTAASANLDIHKSTAEDLFAASGTMMVDQHERLDFEGLGGGAHAS